MNEYPHILTETEEGLTFEPCAMCERDATIEHEGKGYCRDHYLDVMFGIAVLADKEWYEAQEEGLAERLVGQVDLPVEATS